MKRYIVIGILLLAGTMAYSQKVGLYLGFDGGAGAMITRSELNNFGTTNGIRNVFISNSVWSAHVKGQALLGVWRIRLGYQFLYNFAPHVTTAGDYFTGENGNTYTTYFNSKATHFFGHYFIAQIAAINAKHFKLVPGVALGTFTGFNVDNNTGERIYLNTVTHKRFSVGAELNAEVVFGRTTFFFGPNYYLFSLRDRAENDWRQYQHFIGGDIGLRFNLLKPSL